MHTSESLRTSVRSREGHETFSTSESLRTSVRTREGHEFDTKLFRQVNHYGQPGQVSVVVRSRLRSTNVNCRLRYSLAVVYLDKMFTVHY